jgi:chemotaxis protein MotB
MKQTPKFEKLKDNVQMSVTGEGLRIELMENEKGIFFNSGSAAPTGNAKDLLVELSKQLGELPNSILIEGHTDSKPFGDGASTYSNWELSSDRANAARKLMQESGLRPNQVAEIRGYADQNLRLPDKPEDPSNRRISIIVRYIDAPPNSSEKDAPGKDAAGKAVAGNTAKPAAPAPEHAHK